MQRLYLEGGLQSAELFRDVSQLLLATLLLVDEHRDLLLVLPLFALIRLELRVQLLLDLQKLFVRFFEKPLTHG
jgi:hypothetical protein